MRFEELVQLRAAIDAARVDGRRAFLVSQVEEGWRIDCVTLDGIPVLVTHSDLKVAIERAKLAMGIS